MLPLLTEPSETAPVIDNKLSVPKFSKVSLPPFVHTKTFPSPREILFALELPVTVAPEVKLASIVTTFESAVKVPVNGLNVTAVPIELKIPSTE